MGTLNKIFEKMGLYDLFVLLFTGIIIVSVTIFLNRLIFDCQLLNQLALDETASFVLVSYFMGLCFHEISSLLIRVCIAKDDNGMLMRTLAAKNKWQPYLPELGEWVNKENENESSEGKSGERRVELDKKCVAIYQVSKNWYAKNGDSARNERDQYTAGISRSLSLYFAMVTLAIIGRFIFGKMDAKLIYAVVSTMLAVVFYFRYERFTYMRYIRIIRAYIYGVAHVEKDN